MKVELLCFGTEGTGQLKHNKEAMNRKILDRAMKMGHGWIFHQDPNHEAQAKRKWLKKNIELIERPSKSPDLNPTESLCREFKLETLESL